MRSVSISAPCNGSGKTSLICSVLHAHPARFAVVKSSTIYPEEIFCPANEQECACRNLDGNYVVIDDLATIRCADTDTSRIDGAGALQTLWCLARPGYHDMAWGLLRRKYLDADMPLLLEGNNLVRHAQPDVKIFVVNAGRPREIWKENTWEMIASSDLVVLNISVGSEAEHDRLKVEIVRHRGCWDGVLIEDVRLPLGSWNSSALAERLNYILGSG